MSAGRGALTVQAGMDDESVVLVIADNGSGMTEAELSQLFTPYFTTKRGGTGLGMMIVQRILRAHGGNIGVDSKKGTGTVVTLRLPRKEKRVRMLA
jgi:signal transduction histidine kinase